MRKLKSNGTVDLQAKQSSFVTEDDFLQLLKYDENCTTDNARTFTEFSHAIDISRPMANVPLGHNGLKVDIGLA